MEQKREPKWVQDIIDQKSPTEITKIIDNANQLTNQWEPWHQQNFFDALEVIFSKENKDSKRDPSTYYGDPSTYYESLTDRTNIRETYKLAKGFYDQLLTKDKNDDKAKQRFWDIVLGALPKKNLTDNKRKLNAANFGYQAVFDHFQYDILNDHTVLNLFLGCLAEYKEKNGTAKDWLSQNVENPLRDAKKKQKDPLELKKQPQPLEKQNFFDWVKKKLRISTDEVSSSSPLERKTSLVALDVEEEKLNFDPATVVSSFEDLEKRFSVLNTTGDVRYPSEGNQQLDIDGINSNYVSAKNFYRGLTSSDDKQRFFEIVLGALPVHKIDDKKQVKKAYSGYMAFVQNFSKSLKENQSLWDKLVARINRFKLSNPHSDLKQTLDDLVNHINSAVQQKQIKVQQDLEETQQVVKKANRAKTAKAIWFGIWGVLCFPFTLVGWIGNQLGKWSAGRKKGERFDLSFWVKLLTLPLLLVFWPDQLIKDKDLGLGESTVRILHIAAWVLLAIFIPPLLGKVGLALSAEFLPGLFSALEGALGVSSMQMFFMGAMFVYASVYNLVQWMGERMFPDTGTRLGSGGGTAGKTGVITQQSDSSTHRTLLIGYNKQEPDSSSDDDISDNKINPRPVIPSSMMFPPAGLVEKNVPVSGSNLSGKTLSNTPLPQTPSSSSS